MRRTFSVFTENRVGLLARVTSVFTRRHVNIESLTVSESEIAGIHRFTIVASLPRDLADKVVAQLDKQVEVVKAFVHDEDEVVHRDLALYKVRAPARSDEDALIALAARHGARVLAREEGFWVLERTGSEADNGALLGELGAARVLEFVRSGSVALTRPMRMLSEFLQDLEDARRASW